MNIIKSGIYSITNLVNNKKYVGKSVSIYSRFGQHRTELRRNEHCNKYLQHAWNKYGEENFKFEIIEEHDKENLREKEIYWINEYKTLYAETGYNLIDESKLSNEDGKNLPKNRICEIDENNQLAKVWSGVYELAVALNISIKRMYKSLYGTKTKEGSQKRMYKGKVYVYESEYDESFEYFVNNKPRRERTDYPDTAGAIIVVNNENYILQRFENTTEAATYFNLSKEQMNNRLSEGRFINNTLVIREKYFDATKDYFTKPAPKERDCPSKSIINIETGEIYIFTSYKKVEQELGLKSNKLYEVVKGNKLSYKGWKAYIN